MWDDSPASLSDLFVFLVWTSLFCIFMFHVFRSLRIVPQRYAMVVERLGRYHVTLMSGFHILIPWIDRVAFTFDLKEESLDVPPQECFTKDEVKVNVDGVLYLSVLEPLKAAYGITNYKWAAMQLAQTTTRSVIGRLSLDQTFEERAAISSSVVHVLEQTGAEWGIRVHRYEIKNIQPPKSVQTAMEKQVTAERERRALIAKSEGDRQARINRSEGQKTQMVNSSEGEKQKRINEAEGRASEIKALADATSNMIESIGQAIMRDQGEAALKLKLSQQLIQEYGKLANKSTKVIAPLDVTKIDSWLKDLGLTTSQNA